MSAGRKQRNMTVNFVKEQPASDAANANMLSNFAQAFPGSRALKPGVSLRMLLALAVITLVAAFGCAVLGLALAGLGAQ